MDRTGMSLRARHQLAICAAVAAVLAVGCNRKALQPPDATGSGGSISFDGGQDRVTPSTDVALDLPIHPPAFDALPDLPPDVPVFPGARSFVVTSQLQRDGGFGTFPSAHVFTMVVNGDRRSAIIGAAGEGSVQALESLAGGVLRVPLSVRFTLPASCAGSSVTYSDFRFAIDANGGLTGTGQGQVVVVSGDVASGAAATMVLTGVPDAEPPRLTIAGDATDPFASFTVVSSEPLVPSGSIVLRAASGETTELSTGGIPGTLITLFQKPAQVLRYATEYSLVTDAVADFAGNAATGPGSLTFTTRALPPLAAEDGFEGVATTTFGGVPVLSGAGAPTITGATSLYIAPVSSFDTTQPPLAVRLQLTAGDTVIRFNFRTVTPGGASGPGFTYGVGFAVGTEGGTFTGPTLPGDPNTTRTAATIGGVQVSLGPILTAAFSVPTDATTEVVLQRTHNRFAGCGLPQPSIAGIIIDDLRVE
jgi:hypothetical protein